MEKERVLWFVGWPKIGEISGYIAEHRLVERQPDVIISQVALVAFLMPFPPALFRLAQQRRTVAEIQPVVSPPGWQLHRRAGSKVRQRFRHKFGDHVRYILPH